MTIFLNILGILSVPVSIFVIFFLFWPGNTETGGGLAWFLIFSMLTFGLLPVLTLINFALTIRIIRVFFAWAF